MITLEKSIEIIRENFTEKILCICESDKHYLFTLQIDDPYNAVMFGVDKASGKIDELHFLNEECMNSKIIKPYSD